MRRGPGSDERHAPINELNEPQEVVAMLTDQLFLISIAVLTLVVLLVLGMVLYFAARRSHAKPSSDPKV
ncbi:hypothetical protein HER20_34170, partial [Rhizobium sp. BUS002]|nr:hypothetical protein [Rhizobium phaseoli]